MTELKESFGSSTAMTITNLNSLGPSTTTGWQSAVVDNTSDKAIDVEVNVILNVDNTPPVTYSRVYIYVYAGYYDGSVWKYTLNAAGTEGTIFLTKPSNFILVKTLAYMTQNETLKSGGFFIAKAFGGKMPDAWGIIIVNDTTGTFEASGNAVTYKLYKEAVA